MRFPTLFFLGVSMAWSQAPPPKLPEPYQSIVELSHSAPPEFAADALLRMVESGKLADRDAKRRLLEEAFRLAQGATFPIRMRALPGLPVDNRAGFLGRAYGLQLDALSLESRAVKVMLAIDVPGARELFDEIPPPALAPLSCDDALVYDLSNFYQLLGAMVNRGFTEKERAKEEHVNFLLGFIARASSPLQFAPLADVIENANVTPAQREVIQIRFNGMLENTRPDGRAFSVLLADRSKIPPQLQAFLDKNAASGAGCPDDAIAARPPAAGSSKAPRSALTSASTPKLDPYWQSPEAQRLLEDGTKLRYNANNQALSDADRATPEWRQRLADYLNELANWGPADEKSEADYFHQKCMVFVNLIDLIPPGSDRDQALAAFIGFLNGSSLQRQSPVEWYLEASGILERVRGQGNGEPDKVQEGFEGSGNPILALSNALENALGRKIPDWAIPQATSRP
jgi:hypothetical protein